jgi:hypothetical protein
MATSGGDVNITRPAGVDGLDEEQPMETSPTQAVNHIPNILPHERVFPIQIGCELFKLSGASISSDGACFHCSADTHDPVSLTTLAKHLHTSRSTSSAR